MGRPEGIGSKCHFRLLLAGEARFQRLLLHARLEAAPSEHILMSSVSE